MRVMDPDMHCNHFLRRHFVRTYTCNSKTTGLTQMFYMSDDCSTIKDVYFLCKSWLQDTNGKLRYQTPITVCFQEAIFPYTVYLDT